MKNIFRLQKKQFSTLALGCALIASTALALVNCTDPAPPATFTVKFDTNGGEPAVKDKTVENGKLLAKPATEPSKEGYTFVGWYKDQALTQAFNFSTEKIIANITLYAKWIEAYTVTFDTNGGTNVDPQSVENGEKASTPTDPTKEGFSFVGWYKDKALTQAFNFSTEKITADITLYAKWIETYTVTFDTNGGSNSDPQTIESGKKASRPSDPTKTDSSFAGWYTDQALTQAFDFDTETITADITLYAKWVPEGTAVTYTVTFYSNQGSKTDPQTVESGKKASKPNDPTGTGYTFVNWYADAALDVPFDFNANTITKDITLYAKWIPITYSVTFIPNNGEDAISRTVAYGSPVPRPENPTKADSSFAGWYKDQARTQTFDFTADKVTQDITLYAKWVPQGTVLPYTVTFNLNGGEATLTDKAVKDGESLEKPATDPTKRGHTFAGWFNDQVLTQAFDFNANTITQDTTLYAKWTPNAYTVTFNYNNGEPQTDLQKKVNYGLTVEDPAPTREGYNLENWYSDENLKSVFDLDAGTITQDTTLYAKWAPASYTATFIPNNGEDATSLSLAYKSIVPKLGGFTKADSTFAGWFKDQAFTQTFDFDTEKITADITFYAKWVAVYTVTFDANGGTNVNQQSVVSGEKASRPADPIKTDSTFAGWFNDQALTQAFDFGTEKITANITLYAKWVPITYYTVTFNSNEGSKTEPQTVESGEKASKPTDPTKTRHSFLGWFSDQALTQAFDFDANTITQDTTLYAKWESNLVDIPDANFRARLKTLIPGAFVGEQLDAKSPDVTEREELNIAPHYFPNNPPSFKSLEGIQYFTKLKRLDCGQHNLTALDVSNNTQLTGLVCFENSLTVLDVSKNTQLTGLVCWGNDLSALDVSKNTQLTYLNCGGNNLTVLDVSNHTQLTRLSCEGNDLSALDVSKNTKLRTLECSSNNLNALDMRGMRRVKYAWYLSIHAATGETNVIKTLKIHENLKDNAQISAVKTARGDKVKIETYSAAEKSTAYTLLCSDYDPTVGSEVNRCGDELKYTVVFNSREGSLVDTLYLYYEGLISTPANPTKADSVFVGWYKDAGLTQAFDFNADNITQDTTLYARWASNKLTKANKHLLSRVDANKKATIMEGVVSIGEQAFYNNGLTAVALPNSLTTIGYRAFESNILTSVTLPNSLTEMEAAAFKYNKLTSVTIPEGVTTIGNGVFQNNDLTSVTLPDSLIAIGEGAFANNDLTSVTIPEGVIAVTNDAFTTNPDLETVTLSEALYNAIVQKTTVEIDFGQGYLTKISHAGLDSTFGSQVATYQTHDGTRLNEDATDASN